MREIESYGFGRVIDGREETRDVIVLPKGVGLRGARL
jgi:hypothetical protein